MFDIGKALVRPLGVISDIISGDYRKRQEEYNTRIQDIANQTTSPDRERFLRDRTMSDFNVGIAKGRDLLTLDPRVESVRKRLEDLSKGYSGEELGAIRGSAVNELAGQRSQYLRQLASRAARGGIGGARAAAMQAAADENFMQARADQERKMALDSAQLKRQGIKDYSDFLMRQRFGELATGAGMANLAQAAYAQAGNEQSAKSAAAIAAQQRPRGVFGELLGGLFG